MPTLRMPPPLTVQIDWFFSDGNSGGQGTGGALDVTASSVVQINPQNDNPVLVTPLTDQYLYPNVPFNYTVPAETFVDPNLDEIFYSVSMADGTGLPPWLTFINASRTLYGTPDEIDHSSSFEILITATDSNGLMASDLFLLSVATLFNGTDGSDNITGTAGNDCIYGFAGNDTLNSGTGNDYMYGGDGNDTYYVREAGDVVIETNNNITVGGTDLVYSYINNYTLPDNVERGRIMSTLAANLTGNNLSNILYAGVGENVLTGGLGMDTVSYYQGVTGTTGVTVNLAITTAQATGGSGSDTLTSIERLIGSKYNDVLTGDFRANRLTGGLGKDTLTGGLGNDVFDFDAIAETGIDVSTWDVITDFVSGQDKIDLSTIDANVLVAGNNAFTTVIDSVAAFTAAGQLRVTGGVLYGNVDADADAEFAIEMTGISTLTTSDFIL